jgi:hypothetical protein
MPRIISDNNCNWNEYFKRFSVERNEAIMHILQELIWSLSLRDCAFLVWVLDRDNSTKRAAGKTS